MKKIDILDISWRKVRGRKIKDSDTINKASSDIPSDNEIKQIVSTYEKSEYKLMIDLAKKISIRTNRDFFEIYIRLKNSDF